MNALRIPLVLLAAAALALSGCSTSDPDAAVSPTPSPTATVPPGYGYGPKKAGNTTPAPAVFVGASVRADQTFAPSTDVDVVDLRFTGWRGRDLTGCDVRYVDPPATDAVSGEPVEIEGAALLQVTCPQVTSVGPDSDRFSSPDTENVTEVVKTGYDGSTLTWTIGLQRRAPFGLALVTFGSGGSAREYPEARRNAVDGVSISILQ